MYQYTDWKDHVTLPANCFKITDNGDGTVTITPAGTVMQQGTPQDQTHFGNLEKGMLDAHTAALLLLALGASWETVLEDYLLTNIQTKQQRETMCQGMARRDVAPELIEEIRTIESVEPVYLETCRRLIEEKYGSLDPFFVRALGLTEEKRIRLREKYTCSAT